MREYLAGASAFALAPRYGVTDSTITRVVRRHGFETRGRRSGTEHPRWRGGRKLTAEGYVEVLVAADDPLACMRKRNSYVLEHRLVVARWLGRPLSADETVHHIDGDRTDNRVENLQLRSGNHGAGQVRCCADCGSRNITTLAL